MYTDKNTSLYFTNCALIWEFESFPQTNGNKQFFNTKGFLLSLNVQAVSSIPVSRPPIAFPGALTYIKQVHQAGKTTTFKWFNVLVLQNL